MLQLLRPALFLLVILTLITGAVYPLVVTGIAQSVFPAQADGSLIMVDGKPVGSALIGQNFTDPKYFWGRPSATGPYPYNAAASGGSNLGPLNPALADAVKARVAALKASDPGNGKPLPADLVSASASGLDPHISPAAARYQIARIAQARGLAPARLVTLVEQQTEARQWGLFGEPRINVLQLNLLLDKMR